MEVHVRVTDLDRAALPVHVHVDEKPTQWNMWDTEKEQVKVGPNALDSCICKSEVDMATCDGEWYVVVQDTQYVKVGFMLGNTRTITVEIQPPEKLDVSELHALGEEWKYSVSGESK